MLMIYESLMRFRALLSANIHKIYDLLQSKVSFYHIYISSYRRVISFSLLVLCVKTTLIRPKGSIVWKAYIIQLTEVLDFVDLGHNER